MEFTCFQTPRSEVFFVEKNDPRYESRFFYFNKNQSDFSKIFLRYSSFIHFINRIDNIHR